MNQIKRKLISVSLTLAMVAPLAVACTKTDKPDTDTERVLRIAVGSQYGDEDEYFRQQFTEIFEFANPNIKLEFVSTMDEKYRYGNMEPGEKMPDPTLKMKEVMQGDNPPDVVMLGYDQLKEIINDNLLEQLDQKITKDKFDTSDIVPVVIDGIKSAGDGKLYALAPTFSSSALIYNKKLFTDAGVSFPTDGMTWDQAFDLAKLVAKGEGDERKNGFAFSTHSQMDLFYGLQQYTAPLQLRMFDEAGEKMTVDTEQWEKVWTKMVQIQKDGAVAPPADPNKQMQREMNQNNPFAYDDFMSGRLAMGIINYGQINQLLMANKNAASFKGYTPIEWDVVTIPSHPEFPNVGGNIYMNGIMGINAKAQNSEDAWKFIKFINGPDWARSKSHSSYNLVARKSYLKPKDGAEFNMAAFYKMIPAPMTDDYKIYRTKPNIYQVQGIGQQLLQKVIKGEITVKDALKKWQTEGDVMLQQMKDNPDAQINPMSMTAVPAG